MSELFPAQIWADMFGLGLPVLEKVLRPWLVYIFLVVGLRLFGKRELAQTNTFDLIVLLTLSNTLQNAIIGDDNSSPGREPPQRRCWVWLINQRTRLAQIRRATV